MWSRTSQVSQNVLIGAARVLQGIGQDRQSVKGPIFVDVLSDGGDAWSQPGPVQADGTKRVADDVAEIRGLGFPLLGKPGLGLPSLGCPILG